MAKEAKQLFCDYCGADCGFGVREWRERISCGARDCNREEQNEYAQEREEAHGQLDRDMGYF